MVRSRTALSVSWVEEGRLFSDSLVWRIAQQITAVFSARNFRRLWDLQTKFWELPLLAGYTLESLCHLYRWQKVDLHLAPTPIPCFFSVFHLSEQWNPKYHNFKITVVRLQTQRDINTLEERDKDDDTTWKHFLFNLGHFWEWNGGTLNSHLGMVGSCTKTVPGNLGHTVSLLRN